MKSISILLGLFIMFGVFASIIDVSAEVLPPKKQMQNGVSAEDVVCKDGYTLMIKINGNAACVSADTATKLSNMGWGKIIKTFERSGDETKLTEEISLKDGSSESEETVKKKVELSESMAMGN